jgi:hypothetical protein
MTEYLKGCPLITEGEEKGKKRKGEDKDIYKEKPRKRSGVESAPGWGGEFFRQSELRQASCGGEKGLSCAESAGVVEQCACSELGDFFLLEEPPNLLTGPGKPGTRDEIMVYRLW